MLKWRIYNARRGVVAGGHMTDVQPMIMYANVFSRVTERIALMMAVLNGMSFKTSDILNAYIKAPHREKVYTILGPEFVTDEGKMVIIVRELYRLNSSGAYFQNHLVKSMQLMGYKPCLTDPDLWTRQMNRSNDDF